MVILMRVSSTLGEMLVCMGLSRDLFAQFIQWPFTVRNWQSCFSDLKLVAVQGRKIIIPVCPLKHKCCLHTVIEIHGSSSRRHKPFRKLSIYLIPITELFYSSEILCSWRLACFWSLKKSVIGTLLYCWYECKMGGSLAVYWLQW